MRPLLVTAGMLERMKACFLSREKFRELWPEGCLVTVKNVRQARKQQLDPDWFCRRFIRKNRLVYGWYVRRLDRARQHRTDVIHRNWARVYKLSVERHRVIPRAEQAAHNRLILSANRAFNEASDRAIVMAINKAREERECEMKFLRSRRRTTSSSRPSSKG